VQKTQGYIMDSVPPPSSSSSSSDENGGERGERAQEDMGAPSDPSETGQFSGVQNTEETLTDDQKSLKDLAKQRLRLQDRVFHLCDDGQFLVSLKHKS
jgi:hypothetical protein